VAQDTALSRRRHGFESRMGLFVKALHQQGFVYLGNQRRMTANATSVHAGSDVDVRERSRRARIERMIPECLRERDEREE
jgi:hypothetical protein